MSKIYLICYYTSTEMSALRGRTSKAISKHKACVKISLKRLVFNEIHIFFFWLFLQDLGRFYTLFVFCCALILLAEQGSKFVGVLFCFSWAFLGSTSLLYPVLFYFYLFTLHFFQIRFCSCIPKQNSTTPNLGWWPEPKSLSVNTSSKFLTVTWKWKITNKKTLKRQKKKKM